MLLVITIRRQEEGGLAREVLEEQLALGYRGLGQEVREISAEIGIPDASRMEVQKEQVKEAIQINHLMKLKEEMSEKEKLADMVKLDLRKPQEYTSWNVEECRMAYRLQTKMFNCRANMPCRYKRDLAYRACGPDPATGMDGPEETQDHLEVCKGYSELWQGLSPMTPKNRVRYFILVKNKRLKKQK